MRLFCRLLVCSLVLALVPRAWATRINILDPFTTVGIATSPFAVTFDPCSSDELPAGDTSNPLGCFAGVNHTGDAWKGLTLTLEDPTHRFDFSCNDDPNQIFAVSRCTYDVSTGLHTLLFTDGTIDTRNGFFVITEDDLPPSSLSFTATAQFASTPEPPASMLLATGLLCLGTLAYRRRQTSA